tara:strand:+ start:551 stop:808 length:258 start_codon:yes stop_codon:yes gene_type:complete
MTEIKIGDQVYEIFDPKNNGPVQNITETQIIVNTKKGYITYPKNRVTNDYHLIINNLIENVEEWKSLWFQNKKDTQSLYKLNKSI